MVKQGFIIKDARLVTFSSRFPQGFKNFNEALDSAKNLLQEQNQLEDPHFYVEYIPDENMWAAMVHIGYYPHNEI